MIIFMINVNLIMISMPINISRFLKLIILKNKLQICNFTGKVFYANIWIPQKNTNKDFLIEWEKMQLVIIHRKLVF